MINTVKGKALEVAEYLTPVLKVSPGGSDLLCTGRPSPGPQRGRVLEGGGTGRAAGCCLLAWASGPMQKAYWLPRFN